MKCYSRGALRFFVVLILIETRAVLITRFPLALIFSCAGFPTFAYLGFFFSWYSRAKCQTLGGGLSLLGGVALLDFLFLLYFPGCSADHERDWPPCKVVFSGWHSIRRMWGYNISIIPDYLYN